jgi:hypothetical protein
VILVDSSAWIDHLRHGDRRLVQFLGQQRVRTCDVVVGELLLGSGLPRTFASNLLALPFVPGPSAAETRRFVERNQHLLSASGVGWADAQILLTAAKSGARIHTADRAVRKVGPLVGVTPA